MVGWVTGGCWVGWVNLGLLSLAFFMVGFLVRVFFGHRFSHDFCSSLSPDRGPELVG